MFFLLESLRHGRYLSSITFQKENLHAIRLVDFTMNVGFHNILESVFEPGYRFFVVLPVGYSHHGTDVANHGVLLFIVLEHEPYRCSYKL